ncbi:sulfotransferase family 2 domain-containing protein [Halomonas stenophila]|uniref:Sulfotransferase family protein n=1 Tax=Halomonas stenophila TaxID=795312 RepID=A0A7W5EQG8_9GAMM|nr:hypothetical protein [Halomonas stenophila]
MQIWLKHSQFSIGMPDWVYRYLWMGGDPFIEGFHRYQSIFIHIPKAAGSSVADALFKESGGHRPIRRYLAYSPDLVDHYFTFTFVRNPWDRCHSAYHYFACRAGSDAHRDHRWASAVLSGINSFREFVLLLKDLDYAKRIKRYDHFRDQVDWLVDPVADDFMVDFIGRFEVLGEDFEHIKNKMGVDVALPHHRKGGGGSYLLEYDEEMKEIVGFLYSRDIERLGYVFEGSSGG